MNIQIIVVTGLFISAFISISLAAYSMTKLRAPGALWYMFLMLSIACYAFGYAIELNSSTFNEIYLALRIQYLGIPVLPAFWFLMAFEYTGKERPRNWWFYLSLFVIPFITFVLVNTNEYHHLYYKGIDVVPSGSFHLSVIHRGIWYYIHTGYNDLMILFGNIMFLMLIFRTTGYYRKQAVTMFSASMIPWAGNILYQFNIQFDHFDSTPFFLTVAEPLLAISLFKFRMFDLVPIARNIIFERMEDPLIVLDRHHRVADINQAARTLFNLQPEKTIGMSDREMFENFPDLVNQIRGMDDQTLKSVFLLPQSDRYFDLRAISILSKTGKFVGKTITLHDVTAEKKAIDKVVEQSHHQKELLHILCHDLANPFGNLKSLLDMAKESPSEFKELGELMQISITNGLETIDLVRQMRTLEDKPDSLNIQRENLLDLVNNSKAVLESKFVEKQIKLDVNINAEHEVLVEKTSFVTSVLNNIFSNAIKFSCPNDTITVRSKRNGKTIELSIQDHGIGMPATLIKDIFNFSKSTSRPGTAGEQGTGFGMPLVKRFIEAYEGSLEIKSKEKKEGSVDHGTEIKITLKAPWNQREDDGGHPRYLR